MKFIIAIMAALFITGCTKEAAKETAKDVANKIACDLQTKVVAELSTAIATELACENKAAIEAYLTVQAEKTNVCKKEEAPASAPAFVAQSSIGTTVCSLVIDTVATSALDQIPADWKCTGGVKFADAKAKILAKCQEKL